MAAANLDDIATFVHVVRAGSFTAAARQRGVPKSTLSRALTRLEAEVGMTLLRRSSRRVGLTEAGRTFYERAAPHVAGLRDAIESVGDGDADPQGTLRITAPIDTAESFLGDMLVRFTARFPRINVEVDLSTHKLNLVEEGIDVALRASPRLDDASLVAKRLGDADLRLFAAPTYLARHGAPALPEALVEHECVLFRPIKGQNEWPLRGPSGERRVTVTGRVGGNDFAFIRGVLRAGAGIGLLPSFQAARELSQGTLAPVLPEWSWPVGSVYIVYLAARPTPRKVVAFRDFMMESYPQLGTTGP
jgi:DNA-binding transcriptional LysR family regulator